LSRVNVAKEGQCVMDWLTTFFQNLGSTPPDAGEVLVGSVLIAGAAKWLYDLVAKIYLKAIEDAVNAYLLANRYSLPVFGGIAATALGLGALLPAVLAAIPLILCLLLSWKWPAVLSQRIGRVSCEQGLLMSAVLLFTVVLSLEEYSDYRVRQVTSFAIVLPPHIDNPATVVSDGFKDGVARFTYEDIYAAIGDAFRGMKRVKVLPQPPADKEFDKLFREQSQTFDVQKRAEITQKMERLLLQDIPDDRGFYWKAAMALWNRVQQWPPVRGTTVYNFGKFEQVWCQGGKCM
jgi:hypothetical protein